MGISLTKNNSFSSRLGKAIMLTFLTLSTLPSVSHSASLSDLFGDNATTTVDKKKPLPVNQAFNVVPLQQGNQLTVQINITDGYYAYKDKLKLELPNDVTAKPFKFSLTPNFVDDPDFGRVPVFEQTVTATTTLSSDSPIVNQPATVKWQGCAKAGLCYPPEKVKFTIQNLSATATTAKDSKDSQKDDKAVKNNTKTASNVQAIASSPATIPTEKPAETILPQNNAVQIASTINPASVTTVATASTASQFSQALASSTASATLGNNSAVAQSNAIASSVANLPQTNLSQNKFDLKEHTGLALLLLFLAGLGLAFTPCVLPMLPIVANIVARQHNPTAKKGLMLTGAYGLGVATSYGILGAIVAVFGQSLGLMNMLQNPVILLGFAGLFVLLGLYMLDWLPIRLPMAISQRLQKFGQIGENRLGSVTGSFITGFFSALVVSPCVSAPLAGAVAGVATLGNPVIGFFALFLLGLGLSTPLIILGATQGNIMPKAGEWMNWVKKGFALMLFAVSLLMIERVFLSPIILLLWAIWFAVVAVWAWQWRGKAQLLTKALALVLGGWMLCLLAGVATGSSDSWQPLTAFTQSRQSSSAVATNQSHTPITVHRLDELQPLIAKYPNLLVDVTADWCIECRIMDKTLFANPPTSLANWQVARLDVTESNADSKAVYETLQVFGPPVMLYYQQGKLVARQNGETKRGDFEATLKRLTP